MRDSKKLTQQAERSLRASSKHIPTEAGQKDSRSRQMPEKELVIDAINQMFAEFQLVYHNQYNKAFPDPEKLTYAKKLWFSNLKDYQPEQILAAAHRAIKESEFLPTIRGILKYFENAYQEYGLPDARAAYIEACRAPSPKGEFNWTHPAIYYAGRESDWFFIANNSEYIVFPVFQRNYQILCERVIKGEELEVPVLKALPEEITKVLSKEEQKAHLKKLREETGI